MNARPIEMLILLGAVAGLCCVLFSLRMSQMYIRDLTKRRVNGLKMYIARAHRRDEILRVAIMCGYLGMGFLLTEGTVLDPIPDNLWWVRALLLTTELAIVSKSVMNIRDGFELTEIQNARKQRSSDIHPTAPKHEGGDEEDL